MKDLGAASNLLPSDQPVVMLNLVRLNTDAKYPENSDFTPCSGVEAWTVRYVKAFRKVVSELGHTTSVVYLGKAHANLRADSEADENWDMLAIVKYPSFAVLREILESEAYRREAQPHRLAALADWKFIATTEIVT